MSHCQCAHGCDLHRGSVSDASVRCDSNRAADRADCQVIHVAIVDGSTGAGGEVIDVVGCAGAEAEGFGCGSGADEQQVCGEEGGSASLRGGLLTIEFEGDSLAGGGGGNSACQRHESIIVGIAEAGPEYDLGTLRLDQRSRGKQNSVAGFEDDVPRGRGYLDTGIHGDVVGICGSRFEGFHQQ